MGSFLSRSSSTALLALLQREQRWLPKRDGTSSWARLCPASSCLSFRLAERSPWWRRQQGSLLFFSSFKKLKQISSAFDMSVCKDHKSSLAANFSSCLHRSEEEEEEEPSRLFIRSGEIFQTLEQNLLFTLRLISCLHVAPCLGEVDKEKAAHPRSANTVECNYRRKPIEVAFHFL